jgi:hypothetical protein
MAEGQSSVNYCTRRSIRDFEQAGQASSVVAQPSGQSGRANESDRPRTLTGR